MALELRAQGQQVGVQLKDVIGGHQPGQHGRGARTQAAGQRDLGRNLELKRVGAVEALEPPHDQVGPVLGDIQGTVYGEAARLLDLDLELERQRGGEDVEPRPEVGRGGRDANQPPAPQAHPGPSTARSIASSVASQGTTADAWSSAVWGSFSPWPVRTQTRRSAPPGPCVSSPATPAAEAGSQKTPSWAARKRYASRI